jgi:hypothetical protein
MIRRYNIDDNIIINNLDIFKAQLAAQSQYCDDVQDEIRKLNEKMLHREKKYYKLKADNTIFLEKIHRLENENVSLRSQLDVYKMFMNNHLVNNNTHMVNNVNNTTHLVSNSTQSLPKIKCLEVDTTTKSVRPMDNVLNELRSKIKPIEKQEKQI